MQVAVHMTVAIMEDAITTNANVKTIGKEMIVPLV